VIKDDYLKLKKINQTAANCFSQEGERIHKINGIFKNKNSFPEKS
jgi:hypothetical protein